MKLDEFTINFSDQFEDNDRDKINKNTKFKDLDGWDSLTTMLVIAMFKTEYGKDITASEIRECSTVLDLFNMLDKNK